MTAVAVAQRDHSPQPIAPVAPATLSLREAVSQVSDSSRNLLGLMALSNAAQRDLNSGSPETTLDGVISKAVLRSLLGALHYRDISTLRHSRRVALLAVGLAHHLGWEGRHLRVLEVAALLHDVGKIGVPDNVLYKPGKLSAAEAALIEVHQSIGINVLQACRVDAEVLKIVEEAHRAHSLKGTNERSLHKVHIGARILAVADAYESLCTEQTYRIAKPHHEIMKLMMEDSGKQFDTNVVSSLARWVQQDGLPFAAQTAELPNKGSRRLPLSLEECAEAMALCQIFSYLHMLETIYDGFHIVDAQRRFVVWNRGAENLVGRAASEIIGTEWSSEILGGTGKKQALGANGLPLSTIDDAIARGKTTMFQLPYRREGEQAVSLELQSVPLIDVDGHLHGVAEIFRNLANSSSTSKQSQTPEIKRLKLQASRDALTSVANRGELERQLRDLSDQYQENPDEPYCVIFADADHFKRINDTYGHQVGDHVLIDMAKHFTEETYSGEIVGRYGGEEFVILCPSTHLDQAVRRADRLRCSLKNAKVGGIDRLIVSCSFGVSQVEPGDTTETVLRRADRALYAAKDAGRDRTCSFTTAQLVELENNKRPAAAKENPFEFSGRFSAFLASEMVIHKLGAFIKDHGAELVDVQRERVLLRLHGARGLFSFRKSPHDRQGIEVELLMEGAERADRSKKLVIKVEIRPFGHFRDAQGFSERTHSIMMELKQYFAAE
jgi:diguanylate cyclase (GGDEF)-like protein/putative nucleotidyltransferase with HDIG domain